MIKPLTRWHNATWVNSKQVGREVGPLKGGLGERCKLPQRGLGRSPSRIRIWCILAIKSDIWWLQFWRFSRKATNQISCSLNSKGKSGPKSSPRGCGVRRVLPFVTSYNIGVKRRRTATATGLYDSSAIFFFYTVSHYIYLCLKKV